MRVVRTAIPVLLVPVLAVTVACTRRTVPVHTVVSRSFPAAQGKLVRLDLRSIDADVTVRDGGTIDVTVDLRVRSTSDAFSRRWIKQHTPVMDDSPASLEIHAAARSDGLFFVGFLSTRARVAVALPPSCRLEVTTASGDVRIDGSDTLATTTRLDTSSGDVRVDGGCADLAVHTGSGDVRVGGPPLQALDVETGSGDVRVTAQVERALVEAGSGDLVLAHLSGSLSAVTGSGNVTAMWDAAPAGKDASVHTRSGDVLLRLPPDTALSGSVSTRTGSISSRIEGTWGPHHRSLTLPPGRGLTLSVRTSSGNIVLRRRS